MSQHLIAVGLRSKRSMAVARGCQAGDTVALHALHDLLTEEGVSAMESIEIGKAYLFRTITHYYTGRVKSKTLTDLVLEDAAWIPDTGRFHECLRKGEPAEVEPYPDGVILVAGAIIDAAPWPHNLPRTVK